MAYEFEKEIYLEIEIPVTVKWTVNPGQCLIMHPADRAQPGFPPQVEDIECHIDKDKVEELLWNELDENYRDDLMEYVSEQAQEACDERG